MTLHWIKFLFNAVSWNNYFLFYYKKNTKYIFKKNKHIIHWIFKLKFNIFQSFQTTTLFIKIDFFLDCSFIMLFLIRNSGRCWQSRRVNFLWQAVWIKPIEHCGRRWYNAKIDVNEWNFWQKPFVVNFVYTFFENF